MLLFVLKEFLPERHNITLFTAVTPQLAGNLYNAEIETPRNDAGYPLLLQGDGNGEFTTMNSLITMKT